MKKAVTELCKALNQNQRGTKNPGEDSSDEKPKDTKSGRRLIKKQQLPREDIKALLLCLFTAVVKLGSARALMHPRPSITNSCPAHQHSNSQQSNASAFPLLPQLPPAPSPQLGSLTSAQDVHSSIPLLNPFFFFFFYQNATLAEVTLPRSKRQFLSLLCSIYRKAPSSPAQT